MEHLLGRGGQGAVFRCIDTRTGEAVAVKALLRAEGGAIPNLRREVRALQELHHPGVVRVLGSGEQAGLPWYAMEIVDGEPLMQHCRRRGHGGEGAHEQRAALTALRRVCEVLAYLHGEGVIHRDLKPQNILVTAAGRPVLVDFGLAGRFSHIKGREELTARAAVGGTISYMSPEQIAGLPTDARTDLYAVGCLLFEILAGRPPFVADTPYALLMAHYKEPAPAPSCFAPGLDGRLDALALGLLKKLPRERIGYAGTVASILAEVGARDGMFVDAPAPRPYLYRPDLSGRGQALEIIRSAVGRLAGGAGGVIFLIGESGIGKTRCAIEAVRIADELELAVLTGECEEGGRTALAAFRRPLLQLGDHCLAQGKEATHAVFAARGRVLGAFQPAIAALPGIAELPPPPELPGLAAVLRVQQFVVETLRAHAATTPLLLVVDDLHWAEELSVAVLEHLIDVISSESLPILLLASVRQEAMTGALQRLIEQSGGTTVALGRLSPPFVATMVGDMLALDPPPENLSAHIAEQTEGNPFFVAEYLRGAVDHGLLWRDEWGRWRVEDAVLVPGDASPYSPLPLPKAIRELVRKRLAALSAPARSLLQVAAAVGPVVDEELLQVIVAKGAGPCRETLARVDVGGLLRELTWRQMLEASEEGELRFSHARLVEAAYDEIEGAARTELHGVIADALGELPREGSPPLAAMAHHYELAGRAAEARRDYELAATSPGARQAPHEAVEFLRRAADLWGQESSEAARRKRAELLILAAHGAGKLGRMGEAAQVLLDAERDALLGKDDERALHALAMRVGILTYLGDPRAAAEAARAVAVPTASGTSKAAGYLTNNVGLLHFTRGEVASAKAHLLRALEIRRKVADKAGAAGSLANLGMLAQCQGKSEEAAHRFRAAIEIYRELDLRLDLGHVIANLAHIYASRSASHQALPLVTEALQIARDTFDVPGEIVALLNLCNIQSALGDLSSALETAQKCLEVSKRSASWAMITEAELELGIINHIRWLPREALGHFCAAEAAAASARNPPLQASVAAYFARFLWDLGDAQAAIAMWRQAQQTYATTGTSDRGRTITAYGLWRAARDAGAPGGDVAAAASFLQATAGENTGWATIAQLAAGSDGGPSSELGVPLEAIDGWDLSETVPLAWFLLAENGAAGAPDEALSAARNALKVCSTAGVRVLLPAVYRLMDRILGRLGASKRQQTLRERAAREAGHWLASCPAEHRDHLAARPDLAWAIALELRQPHP